jgi:hypothetical protein
MRQRLLLAVALLASTALARPVAADPPAVDNRSSSSPAHQTPVPAVLSSGRVEPSAGSWRTWVIPSGKQYRLPPPPTADESRSEIEQLRALAGRRDAMMLDRIGYWDTGAPSYRWNLILIDEMVGKGAPANIAYRALSVLHIALDDAMVAAWDSKYAYARPHPSELDTQLRTAIPVPRSPSYPAEHAVAAGAAATVLEYLYPKQAEAFHAMGEAAATSRLFAGVAYPSDVAAGLELGRRVAAKVVERAAADGSAAPWSGTVPTGPGRWNGTNPVLPQAATWRTWVLERPDEFRPTPPSPYDSAEQRTELAELRDYPRTRLTNANAGFWEFADGGLRRTNSGAANWPG